MNLDVATDPWLGGLIDEVDELAARLRDAPLPDPDLVDHARDAAAVATLRLDGSPIETVPEDIPPPPTGTATGPARGGWLEVLRAGTTELTRVPDEVVLAVEHRGARAGLDATDLAGGLTTELVETLAALHRRVTDGLLHPTVAGAPRASEQAVHDASLGRVLFFPVDPAHLPERMAALAAWMAADDGHPVVRSGVLHHQLLDLHPYEAANGRTARAAARLVLAAADVDPALVGHPEHALLRDPIAYLDDVARSRRLGTPAAFVGRWTEAVVDGLLDALRSLGAAPDVDVPAATAAFLADVGVSPFTVVDHRRAVGGGAEVDHHLDEARRAGTAVRVAGTRGLRWRSAATVS